MDHFIAAKLHKGSSAGNNVFKRITEVQDQLLNDIDNASATAQSLDVIEQTLSKGGIQGLAACKRAHIITNVCDAFYHFADKAIDNTYEPQFKAILNACFRIAKLLHNSPSPDVKNSVLQSEFSKYVGILLRKATNEPELVSTAFDFLTMVSSDASLSLRADSNIGTFVFEKMSRIKEQTVWSKVTQIRNNYWQLSCEEEDDKASFKLYCLSPLHVIVTHLLVIPEQKRGFSNLFESKHTHTFTETEFYSEFEPVYSIDDILKIAIDDKVKVQINILSIQAPVSSPREEVLFKFVPDKYKRFLTSSSTSVATPQASSSKEAAESLFDNALLMNSSSSATIGEAEAIVIDQQQEGNSGSVDSKKITISDAKKFIPKHWGKVKIYKAGQNGEPFFPKDYVIEKHDVYMCTDIKTNKNKFYSLELHTAKMNEKQYFRLYTHYGRTDDLNISLKSGKRECRYCDSLEQAENIYGLIVEDKTSDFKGYKKVEMATLKVGSEKAMAKHALSNASSSLVVGAPSAPVSSLEPKIQTLVKYIYDEATSALNNVFATQITPHGIETALGVVTHDQVTKGMNILYQIYDAITKSGANNEEELATLSSTFYSLIPHKFGGRQRFDSAVIKDVRTVQDKLEMLQLMKDMLQINGNGTVLHGNIIDMKFKALKCEIVPLAKGSYEYRDIEKHALNTSKSSNPITVQNIYKVTRENEFSNYTSSMQNQQLLFHGSKICNFVGLLSRGLMMPHVVVKSGGARTDEGWLGHGIYFASEMTTSMQYTTQGHLGSRLMLVCRVALGRVKDFERKQFGITSPPQGYDSVRGVKRSPARDTDFIDDEYVVYRQNQQRIEYLIEFSLPSDKPIDVAEEITEQEEVEELQKEIEAAKEDMKQASIFDSFSMNNNLINQEQQQFGKAFGKPMKASKKAAWSKKALATSLAASQQPEENVPAVIIESVPLRLNKKDYDQSLALKEHTLGEMKKIEDHFRELFAKDRKNPELENPYLFLVDAFDYRDKMFKYQVETPEELAIPKILTKERRLGKEGYSVVSQEQYIKNWNEYTKGMLNGLDWNNLFAAGGAVLQNLVTDNDRGYQGTDIDLFLYDLSDEEANNKVRHIYQVIKQNTKAVGEEVTVIRTKNAITFINAYPYRHIQIVLRLYKSPAEVLIGFDIDACCVGFDGSTAWVLPRARRAINKGYNLVDMSRRSLTYEIRLFKYSKRGFAVAVPTLNRNLIDPLLFHRDARQMNGIAKLLLFEHNVNNGKSPYSYDLASKRRLQKYLPKVGDKENEDKLAEYEEALRADPSDYSTVTFPYGPKWTQYYILKMLKYHEKAHMYTTKGRKHVFVQGIDAVLNGLKSMPVPDEQKRNKQLYHVDDDELSRPLNWVKENPGRQLLTGSFHPVDDDHFFDFVYLDKSQEQIQTLCNAAFAGNCEQIMALHQAKVNLDEVDRQEGKTALHIASVYGHASVVRLLIDLGVNVNKTDQSDNQFAALHFAVINGHEEICEVLIQAGANVNLADKKYKLTPLHLAAYYNRPKIVSLLISKKAKSDAIDATGRFPLHMAAVCYHFECIQELMSDNAQLSFLRPNNGNGESALEQCVKRSLACIRALCQPIESVDVASLLSHAPPQVDRLTLAEDKTYSLLSAARRSDKKQVRKAILEKPVEVTRVEKDPAHVTSLHIAAQYDDLDILKIFIEEGDMVHAVNSRDILNQTPLHYAAYYGSYRAAQYLIQKGADVNAANFFGQTPLFYCLDVIAKLDNHRNSTLFDLPAYDVHNKYCMVRTLLLQNHAKQPALLKAPAANYSVPPLPRSLYLLEFPYSAANHYTPEKPSVEVGAPMKKKSKNHNNNLLSFSQPFDGTLASSTVSASQFDAEQFTSAFITNNDNNAQQPSPTTKALMMTSMLFKGGTIIQSEKVLLKKLILAGQTKEIFRAISAFDKKPNIGRLIRKFKHIVQKYANVSEDEWFKVALVDTPADADDDDAASSVSDDSDKSVNTVSTSASTSVATQASVTSAKQTPNKQ